MTGNKTVDRHDREKTDLILHSQRVQSIRHHGQFTSVLVSPGLLSDEDIRLSFSVVLDRRQFDAAKRMQ